MVRRLTITGCLTLLLVSVLVEAHAWSQGYGQVGWASWYGARHHGRKTASGERFSMHALTAALACCLLHKKVSPVRSGSVAHILVANSRERLQHRLGYLLPWCVPMTIAC